MKSTEEDNEIWVNAQTHGINGFSLQQWCCSCPGNLPMRLCESKMTDELTVLLFCDVHIGIGATLNLLQCLHVITLCAYVQQGYAFGCIGLCTYIMYICIYIYIYKQALLHDATNLVFT